MPEKLPQQEGASNLPEAIENAIKRFQSKYAWTTTERTVIAKIIPLEEAQETSWFSVSKGKQIIELKRQLPSIFTRIRRGLKAALNPSDDAAT